VAIANYLAGRPGIGHVFLSPLDVVLSPHDVVEPDLLFVGSNQLDVLRLTNVQGPPALVVEVLSPGTRKCPGATTTARSDASPSSLWKTAIR